MFSQKSKYLYDKRRHSGEYDHRMMVKHERSQQFLHSLAHPKCKSNGNFKSAGYCYPICQEFNESPFGWKKYQRNQEYSSRREFGHSRAAQSQFHSILLGALVMSDEDSKTGKSKKSNDANLSKNETRPTSSCSSSPSKDKLITINHSQSSALQVIKPSAPSLGRELFNNEENADVIFLVGHEKNKLWRIPAHTTILKNAGSYFAAVSLDNTNNNKEIPVECDPEIFTIILKYVYTEEVSFQSIQVALNIFSASIRFTVIPLAIKCLTFLKKECRVENVLTQLKFFENFFKLLNYEKQADPELFIYLRDDILELISKCFKVIDQNADKIILSDEFSMMSRVMVIEILSRDTLDLNSELDAYQSICNWANQQCKQQHKELTDQNRREVLDHLIFLPRYLLMNLDDFMNGPHKDSILTAEEKTALLNKLHQKKSNESTIELPKEMRCYKLDLPRLAYEDNKFKVTKAQTLTRSLSCGDKGFNKINNGKKKRTFGGKIAHGLGSAMFFIIKVLD